ncbi:MAG: 4'-phosphopantetheinyl transferase superfamily protein [Christensenella sp.]
MACISEERRTYADSYRFPDDRMRCLAAGYLLSAYLGRSAQLYVGKYGKLYTSVDNLFFNLSHAGRYVVLAIADREVGIDIEPITAYDDAVARKCFTQSEYLLMNTQASNDAFFKLWTAKESVMKACGKGFYLPPESFELQMGEQPVCVADDRLWHIRWLELNGHILCTAVEQMPEPLELVFCGHTPFK